MLPRFFRGPSSVAAVPSGAGLGPFRALQEKSLKAFEQEALLTDHARRVRNRLMATAAAIAVTIAAVTVGSSAPSPASASLGESVELRAANDQQVEQAILAMEKSATDLFFLKTTGAPAAQRDAAKANVLQATARVYAELRAAVTVGNDAAIEMARNRVAAMEQSDLGKLGVNFMSEAIPPDMSTLYANTGKKARVASPGF